MSFKIVAQYLKDVSFEIPDAKTALLLEKNIKNYKFICDINSKKIKEKIIEVNVNLKLLPINEKEDNIIHVSLELAALIQVEENLEKEELEKIILVKVPTDVYPNLRETLVVLFRKSGFNKVNIDEKIDFLKLYDLKKNQK
tara:strand:+ start:516 stop:938 length:423 start_codon:yes stop_codon:yes gene_type:complete